MIRETIDRARHQLAAGGGGHSENRIWGSWMALFGFGILWIWLLGINTSNDMGMFFGSLAMFGYVVVGLMLASRFLVGRDW